VLKKSDWNRRRSQESGIGAAGCGSMLRRAKPDLGDRSEAALDDFMELLRRPPILTSMSSGAFAEKDDDDAIAIAESKRVLQSASNRSGPNPARASKACGVSIPLRLETVFQMHMSGFIAEKSHQWSE
jgi:hypothetical protein